MENILPVILLSFRSRPVQKSVVVMVLILGAGVVEVGMRHRSRFPFPSRPHAGTAAPAGGRIDAYINKIGAMHSRFFLFSPI